MAEHFTKSQIERFAVSALPKEQLKTVAEHLADCPSCHHMLAEALRSQRRTKGLAFRLDPVDYEQLVDLVENKIDETEREILDIHLGSCATCREDLRSFQAFRDQL